MATELVRHKGHKLAETMLFILIILQKKNELSNMVMNTEMDKENFAKMNVIKF